jgi:hypothetical protein
MTMAEPQLPPGTICAHGDGLPATRMFRLLGGDETHGFGYRPVCDGHYRAETDHKRSAVERHLAFLREHNAARDAEVAR